MKAFHFSGTVVVELCVEVIVKVPDKVCAEGEAAIRQYVTRTRR